MCIDLERGEGREKDIDVSEKHWLVASHMYPNQGSNLPPFGVQGDSQPTEPPGQGWII